MNDIFVILQYCLGHKGNISNVVASMDWQKLYFFTSNQAILGLCFDGIERLGEEYPEELRLNPIGRELLMTWMGKAQQIRRQNRMVNTVASKLFSMLREDGLRCCILKGQGNALMYPNPHSRTPGDIDVWVNASREEITEYGKKHFCLSDDIRFHHLETSLDGVPVELHFFPGIMNNPVFNARLQKWFKRNADLQCSHIVGLPDGAGEIAVPTLAFNVIYQLTHLYHHFFDEGIGMRQIIDYFLVVCDFYKVYQNSSKIHPSSLTLKGGSTAFPKPLSPQGTGDVPTALLGAQTASLYGWRTIRGLRHQRSCVFLCGDEPDFTQGFAKGLLARCFFRKPTSPPLNLKSLSKTHQSSLTLKGGSTSHLGLLPSGKKRKPLLSIVFTTPSVPLVGDRDVARNHFILWLADHQRSTPAAELRFFVRG